MKLTFFLILTSFISLASGSYSQEVKLSIFMEKADIIDVFEAIESQTGFQIAYNSSRMDVHKSVSLMVENKPIADVLKELLDEMGMDFEIINRYIVITDNNSKSDGIHENNESKEISGKVTDAAGVAIPGVTIWVKGTNIGTISNEDGTYSIELPSEKNVLVFSFVGMRTQELVVGDQLIINVVMEDETIGLEEVVAVGYGTMKKRDIIGAISTIDAESLELKSSVSFDAGMQGLASGVLVQSESGIPGSPTKISIRGMNSIKSSTDPLWIVDGMPIYSNPNGMNQSFGSSDQSPMSMINSSDIESIQVLKDAAATAIYGSRASNGVIIITTKTGKKGKGSTQINLSSGIGDLSLKPSDLGYVNTQQWFAGLDESYRNSGREFIMNDYYRYSPYATTILTRDQAEAIDTDWYNEIFRKGSFNDLNLSSSQGFEKGTLFLSMNYRKDEGVMKNNSLERFSARSNIDFSPSENLTVGAKLSFSFTNNNRLQSSDFRGGQRGSLGGLNAITTQALPWLPVNDLENPGRYFNAYSASNPAAFSDPNNYKNEVVQYRGLGGTYVDYNIPTVKGLSLRSEVSFDLIQSRGVVWQGRDVHLNSENEPSTTASEKHSTYQSYNVNAYATYDRTFGDHSIKVIIGTEAQRSKEYQLDVKGEDLTGKYKQLGTPGQMISMSSGQIGERYLLAYFNRTNYSFKGKYLFGLSFRRDGTSAFTKDYRWGIFPAFSMGWILSEENFMAFLGEDNFLKLRLSYGETGNQNVSSGLDVIHYADDLTYGGTSISGVNGTRPSNIAVGELTWESTKTTDVGFDFGFFKNRVNGSLTYYNRKVSDMLLAGPVSFSTGIASTQEFPASFYDANANIVWGNVGDMRNSGIEVELSSVNVSTGTFKWTTTLNATFNKNKVLKLTKDADNSGKGMVTTNTVSRTGGSREEWFIAKWAGIDPQTGISMIYALDQEYYEETGETRILLDENDNEVTTYGTITNIRANQFYQDGKSADPRYFGGITNKFEYKGFDLSFLVIFSGGNYIYDYDYQRSGILRETFIFRQEAVDKAWRNPGDITDYPKLTATGTYILEDGSSLAGFDELDVYYDKYLFNGDFIRLKNIQLGYTFNDDLLQSLKLNGLRIYVTGTNLWTSTKYPGFEPEGARFVGSAQIPQLRSLIVGLNIKF